MKLYIHAKENKNFTWKCFFFGQGNVYFICKFGMPSPCTIVDSGTVDLTNALTNIQSYIYDLVSTCHTPSCPGSSPAFIVTRLIRFDTYWIPRLCNSFGGPLVIAILLIFVLKMQSLCLDP